MFGLVYIEGKKRILRKNCLEYGRKEKKSKLWLFINNYKSLIYEINICILENFKFFMNLNFLLLRAESKLIKKNN